MNRSVKLGLLGVLAVFFLIVLMIFWSYGMRAGHSAILNTVDQLKQHESGFNVDILRSRYGFLSYYDSLNRYLEQMERSFDTIKEELTRAHQGQRAAFSQQVGAYEQALKERKVLKDQFITENAVFNNSFQYFPVLMVDLLLEIRAREGNTVLVGSLEALLRDILIYNATGDITLEPKIVASIKALRSMEGDALKDKLKVSAKHAEIILTGRKSLNTIVAGLFALPSASILDGVSYRAYELNQKKHLGRSRWFSLGFKVVCLIIVGYVFFLMVRLGRMTEALEQTNVSLNREIEDRKKLETKLLHSEKMASIGQLAAGVAHEINNPIGFVTSNIQTLEVYAQTYREMFRLGEDLRLAVKARDTQKADRLVEELSQTEEKANLRLMVEDMGALLKESNEGLGRVKKIVMDLRTFSRNGEAEKELVRVEDVIDGVLGIVLNEIRYRVELKKEYGQTPKIICNPPQLGQVFVNMLINAGQAIERKGEVTIRTFTDNHSVCVAIVDTGHGIPPEIINKIFDPFFTTKRVGEGTGLGLSISYEIVKKIGGTVTVASELGKGTTFTIALPIAPG